MKTALKIVIGVWAVLAPEALRPASMGTGFAWVFPGGSIALYDFGCDLRGYLTWRVGENELIIGVPGAGEVSFEVDQLYWVEFEYDIVQHLRSAVVSDSRPWLVLEGGTRWAKLNDDLRVVCRPMWGLYDSGGRTDDL